MQNLHTGDHRSCVCDNQTLEMSKIFFIRREQTKLHYSHIIGHCSATQRDHWSILLEWLKSINVNGKNGLKGSHKSNCTCLVFSRLTELEILGIFHL